MLKFFLLGCLLYTSIINAQEFLISQVERLERPTSYLFSNDKHALSYLSKLDSVNIKNQLETLASDDFEGRSTGDSGGKKAEQYISGYLKQKGILPGNKGSYTQNIEIYFREGKKKRFKFNNFIYRDELDYPNDVSNDSLITGNEIIFIGYGSYSPNYNDFENIDISNKIIMLLNGMPYNKYGIPYSTEIRSSSYSYNLPDYIESQKPKAVLKVKLGFDKESDYYSSSRRLIFKDEFNSNKKIPIISINELLANKILESSGKTVKQIMYEIEQNGNPQALIVNTPFELRGTYLFEDANANNVIGIVEGSDLKNEYVVVSAHYDHLEKYNNNIYNGADDNASGVAALMEISRVFAQAKKEGKGPRRTIIFLFPAAEEKGLYGSQYYTSYPIFPLEKTVACLNLDMIGRVGSSYSSSGNNNYVYVVNDTKRSGNLNDWVESINMNTVKLKLDYKHTTPDDSDYLFSKSDQYNFARKEIPSIMFTSGLHPDYHKVTDDAEFIDYNGLFKRTKLAFLLTWELANSDSKPLIKKK